MKSNIELSYSFYIFLFSFCTLFQRNVLIHFEQLLLTQNIKLFPSCFSSESEYFMLTFRSISECHFKSLDQYQASANHHLSLLFSVTVLLKFRNCNIDPLNYSYSSTFLSFDHICEGSTVPIVLRNGMDIVCCVLCDMLQTNKTLLSIRNCSSIEKYIDVNHKHHCSKS